MNSFVRGHIRRTDAFRILNGLVGHLSRAVTEIADIALTFSCSIGSIGKDAFFWEVPKEEVEGTGVESEWSTLDRAFQTEYAVW